MWRGLFLAARRKKNQRHRTSFSRRQSCRKSDTLNPVTSLERFLETDQQLFLCMRDHAQYYTKDCQIAQI